MIYIFTPGICVLYQCNNFVAAENNASNSKSVSKRLTHKQRALERDEHTFGTPIDQSLQQDFDFEKNLALFNKEVVGFYCFS